MKRSHIKHLLYYALCTIAVALVAAATTACQDDEEGTYDAYSNWQKRNEAWFMQIADSARTAIRQAQRTYGSQWEQHCQWRMYKALAKSATFNSGLTTDSICVRIVSWGSGSVEPIASDTVRCNYRGWLMPTADASGHVEARVFDQTYYGAFQNATAFPRKLAVNGVVSGFSTALQYMVVGDDWHIYIPYQLAYGVHAHDDIPAYSNLHFRVQLVGIYPKGTVVPAWH